jgi:ribosomal protein S18 acetylase RimI-like enzyme
MNTHDAATIAQIHSSSLPHTFLARLGCGFLTTLYRAMLDDPHTIVIVNEMNGAVRGFIAVTTESDTFFRRILCKRGGQLLYRMGVQSIRHPSLIKNAFQTVLYGKESKVARAPSELLAIAMQDSYRGKGRGRQLLLYALKELRARKIRNLKVMVGADNAGANAFYMKNGFQFAKSIVLYGEKRNIYTRAF